jgi:hypothetical protein
MRKSSPYELRIPARLIYAESGIASLWFAKKLISELLDDFNCTEIFRFFSDV